MAPCVDDLPSSLELTYDCASELVGYGPVAALLIILIGIPLVKTFRKYLRRFFDKTDFDEGIENFIYRVTGIVLWAILLLTAADELGIDVTALLAAFGILGLAVAFAAQDTMENVIAGVFIIMDKPFRIGEESRRNLQQLG